jgi:hypothetical protein
MTDETPAAVPPAETNPPKRGRAAWFGTNHLHVYEQDANFVYRWIGNDPQNVRRHESLGWEIVAGDNAAFRGDAAKDGAPLTSADTFREMVRVRLHKDLLAERDEQLADANKRQWEGIKDNAESEMRKATGGKARVRGSITIT